MHVETIAKNVASSVKHPICLSFLLSQVSKQEAGSAFEHFFASTSATLMGFSEGSYFFAFFF